MNLQRECRARKRKREILSGLRGADGKIKKVTESGVQYVILSMLIFDSEMGTVYETTTTSTGKNYSAH